VPKVYPKGIEKGSTLDQGLPGTRQAHTHRPGATQVPLGTGKLGPLGPITRELDMHGSSAYSPMKVRFERSPRICVVEVLSVQTGWRQSRPVHPAEHEQVSGAVQVPPFGQR
jgi:hypothetical protein